MLLPQHRSGRTFFGGDAIDSVKMDVDLYVEVIEVCCIYSLHWLMALLTATQGAVDHDFVDPTMWSLWTRIEAPLCIPTHGVFQKKLETYVNINDDAPLTPLWVHKVGSCGSGALKGTCTLQWLYHFTEEILASPAGRSCKLGPWRLLLEWLNSIRVRSVLLVSVLHC